MTTPTNTLEKASQLMADQQLRMKIIGALKFHALELWNDSHGDAKKDHVVRQLHENYDYAAGRVLQWLAFNDPLLSATSTDAEIITSVEICLQAHPNGLWRKQ